MGGGATAMGSGTAARFWSNGETAASSKSSSKLREITFRTGGRLQRRPPISYSDSNAGVLSPLHPAANQSHDQQEHDGADRGIDDLRHQPAAHMNAKFWKQEGGDQRAADADEHVADDPKTSAAHDLAGQPAGDQADEQNNQNAFIG